MKPVLKAKTRILAIWIALIIFSFLFFVDIKTVWMAFVSLFKRETLVVFGHGYSWGDILRICRDFPVFGSGLGTFANISAMYKTIVDQKLFVYAHNDSLQLLSETGIVGGAIILVFFTHYFRSLLALWMKRRDTYAVCMVFAAAASLSVMLAYSFLDFNLHIPANALLFFIIMGLAYRIAFSQFTQNDEIRPGLE